MQRCDALIFVAMLGAAVLYGAHGSENETFEPSRVADGGGSFDGTLEVDKFQSTLRAVGAQYRIPTMIWASMLIVGVFTNLVIILTIATHRDLDKVPNWLFAGQAVSDFLFAVIYAAYHGYFSVTTQFLGGEVGCTMFAFFGVLLYVQVTGAVPHRVLFLTMSLLDALDTAQRSCPSWCYRIADDGRR